MITSIGKRSGASEDLVELLLACHQRIRRFLGIAHAAGTREDAPAHEVVEACEAVERYFSVALPLHMADEEDSVLPRLHGKGPECDRALQLMAAQHTEHAPLVEALLGASAELRASPTGAAQRAALGRAASALSEAFEAHLQLEETVIFPAIRAGLSNDEQAKVVQELRARRR